MSGGDIPVSSGLIGILSQKAPSHLPSTEKLTQEEEMSFLVIEEIYTRRTSILCDWVINRWGAVVLPHDRAIDSGRGFALAFDWLRRSGSSWEVAECLSRQIREDVSSPLSRNHLPSSLCPVFSFSLSHVHSGKHTHTEECPSSGNLNARYDGTTAVMQQGLMLKRSIWLFEKLPIMVFWSASIWLKP